MTNKEIAEFMLNKINSFGFKPYKVDYGNGYFVFEMGDNSVVHFRLKGVWKHWKFGMWINTKCLDENYRKETQEKYPRGDGKEWEADDFKVVQVFCQYDHIIDKFKPAASTLCTDINYQCFEQALNEKDKWNWNFNKLECMLKMIKKHPLMCYSGYCGNVEYYEDESFLKEFLKYESEYYKDKINEKFKTFFFYHWTVFKLFFAKRSKIIDNIYLEDFEKENEGWSTDYKYKVHPTFKADTTDEQILKWFGLWFKKENYGKFGTYEYVVKSGSFKIAGDNKRYCMEFGEEES
jgi:hypothetical protein